MGAGGYVSLTNGTPYFFKLRKQGNLNMNHATWPDTVPPFKSSRHYMEFDDTPFRAGTDETWALYDIEGTPENFYVRLDHRKGYNQFSVQMSSPILVTAPASKIIDQGWIQNRGEDMSLRAYFNGTVIIISGVGPFAVSAPGEGSGAWMSMSLGWLGTRSLRRICMPGTHNSGVTKSSVKVSSIIVPPTAVICQSGSIWEQLRWGARYFDIRPAYSNKLGFHTGHYQADKKLGGGGQSIEDIVNNVNDFLKYNPELVILSVTHDYDMENSYEHFQPERWVGLLAALDRLEYRFTASTETDLSQLTLNDLIGNGRGAVVVTFERRAFDYLGAKAGQGYFYSDKLGVYDFYSETADVSEIMRDQFAKMREVRKNPHCRMFSLGWAQTPGIIDIINLHDLCEWGRYTMAPRLGSELIPNCTDQTYPNILNLDGVEGTFVMAAAMAINAMAAK